MLILQHTTQGSSHKHMVTTVHAPWIRPRLRAERENPYTLVHCSIVIIQDVCVAVANLVFAKHKAQLLMDVCVTIHVPASKYWIIIM